MSFKVIIPSRYDSGRLPGKPLADLNGKPMVQWVYEKACKSNADQVIIATDDERIASAASRFGAEVCMTHHHHPTGTDRLQEVVSKYRFSDDEVIVNVQGDEPFIPPSVINQVAEGLINAPNDVAMTTLSFPVANVSSVFDSSVVKVVTDKQGNALYFSRAPLPWDREAFADGVPDHLPINWVYQHHLGIYAYRVSQLHAFVKWGESLLEATERLEQLRFLWNGNKIQVLQAVQTPPPGIDTVEDLKLAREHLADSVIESA